MQPVILFAAAITFIVSVGCELADVEPSPAPVGAASFSATATPTASVVPVETVVPVQTSAPVATTAPTATVPVATTVPVAPTARPAATITPTAVVPVPTATPPPTAVPGGPVRVAISSASGSPGDIVTVEVAVLDPVFTSTQYGSGVGSAQIVVSYDSTILSAVNTTSVLPGSISNIGKAGQVILSYASLGGTPLATGDSLLTIEFKIADGSAPGQVQVVLSKVDLTDTAAPPDSVPTALANGEIVIR